LRISWLTGKVLHVDLDIEKFWIEELPENVVKKLLGGRALASYLLYRYAPKNVDPLSPENPLIIAPGALLGTGIPTISKTTVAFKSPLTGFLGRSSVGALLGHEIKRLGLDAVIIKGSLETPGVLVLDENPRIDYDVNVWGLKVGEARARLLEKYKGYSSCIIGPAGERLSKISIIDCNGRQAARGGPGAVMGAKRLKAIVARGTRLPEVYDKEKLKDIVREWARKVITHPSSKAYIEYGTPITLELTNKKHGVFPSLNWRRSTLSWCPDPSKAHEELGLWAPKRRVSKNPCPFCNRVCSQVIEVNVPEEGKVRVDGPEYETVYALGANIGICDLDKIAVLNHLADEYGLDTISLGVTIAWAIEALERGDLSPKDLDDIELRWGDFEKVVEIIKKIALKEGRVGELLGDGVRAATEAIKKGSSYAIHVKGLELPAYDVRGLKGMALGFAVASRGGDHLTSSAYAVELTGSLWIFKNVDPRSTKGKGKLVKVMEDLMAVYDTLGVCKFSRYFYWPEELSEFILATTGLKMRPEEVLKLGERVVNIERLYNIREGLDVSDDTLPPRILREPISDGPCKGCVVTSEELEDMKAEYYRERGWSEVSGKPTKEKVKELGLDEILEIDLNLIEVER
jgi:aldehyde:ferredoxin oxidoreductase